MRPAAAAGRAAPGAATAARPASGTGTSMAAASIRERQPGVGAGNFSASFEFVLDLLQIKELEIF